MLPKSEAEARWCPFALTQSEVKECSFSGSWKDYGHQNKVVQELETSGKMVAVTVLNRTIDGDPHPDCLCITDQCVFWRTINSDGSGDCAKLDDNMNSRENQTVDVSMEAKWCPHSRPENTVVNGDWTGVISGCTVAVSSPNRLPGGPNPGAFCISKQCMAYAHNGSNGYCMSADKNMQG